jgi:hypothetical protein
MSEEECELWFRSEGKLLKGWFCVRDRTVFVRSEHDRKATQVGGSPPSSIARLLIIELARAGAPTHR